jgi:O-antigen/teichoic acid export membrane protein
MTNHQLAKRAGSALVWQGVQLVGVNGIYLIRIPVLAYLLLPDDFGLMAIGIVALDLVLGITNLGMIPALVQRAELEERHYHAAWTIGALRALAVTVGLFAAAPVVADIFAEPRAAPIVRVLAVRPLLQAAASIRVADLTRHLEFRGLALLALVEALANAGVSIAFAPSLGVWALVVGDLAGSGVYALMSFVLVPYRPRLVFDGVATLSLIRFGRWIFLVSVTSLLGRLALQAVISHRLGTPELGRYYLAAKIASLAGQTAAGLMGAVAFPVYARLQSDVQQAVRAFRALLTSAAALLFPIAGLLIALAPMLVEEVLGGRWSGTAAIIQVLAISSLVGLFGDTAAPIFDGFGQPQKVLVLEAVQTVLLISLAWGLAGCYGLLGATSAWLPATGAAQIIGVVLLRRILPRPFQGLGVPIVVITSISILGAALAFVISVLLHGLLGFAAASLIATVAVGELLLRADRRFDLGLRGILSKVFPALAPSWAPRP